MRFSIWPNMQQPWEDVLAVAQHADTTGWDVVYVADHFMGDAGGFGPVETPTLEATAAMGVIAGATTHVRIGSLVFGTTYRHPAVLANWAATLDRASGGRLVLGIGAGWQENEHDQYGIPLPPVGERVDRFAETCEVMTKLLRTPSTTVLGEWFVVTGAVCEPKPVQDPLPILIGAKGDRMLHLVARYADIWNMWGLPDAVAERSATLDRCCERVGRDPATVERSAQALVMITDDEAKARSFVDAVSPRAAIGGTVDQVAELVAQWQEVGLQEAVIPDWVLGRGTQKLDNMDALLDAMRRTVP